MIQGVIKKNQERILEVKLGPHCSPNMYCVRKHTPISPRTKIQGPHISTPELGRILKPFLEKRKSSKIEN